MSNVRLVFVAGAAWLVAGCSSSSSAVGSPDAALTGTSTGGAGAPATNTGGNPTGSGGATAGSGGASGNTGGQSTTSTGGTAGGSGASATGGTASGGAASGGGTSGGATSTGGTASTDGGVGALPGWTLTWHDEFDGPSGVSPNPDNWVFETGGNGWGNAELEYYTNRTDNAALDGNGYLVITAKKESYMGSDYTSARMKTAGKFDQQYGRFDARIKIPRGQGLWPAFWLLGDNIDTVSWPACGEIDIMENIGKEPSIVHGTIHGTNYSNGTSFTLPNGAKVADDYHVFSMQWEAAAIRFYVDGTLYGTHVTSDLPSNAPWVYDHPFFVLLNVAVGGSWPGSPDGTTVFPQQMSVDYVRVYSKD
ncbi:MAG TPA: glycoside hydrolase family 16 protein [Polyangiaceae bacterium]|nr:glycoside hydrolase family 16 protein [Polyangiaceae bacterium]